MGQDSSKEGDGKVVVEETEETKLECVIKSSFEEEQGDGSEPVNIEEVQEKVKDVICKTVTNVPISENTSKEKLSEIGSAGSNERLKSPTATCLTEEGKLLVKVVKASGLCGKENNVTISPYCVVSTNIPLQKKRTSMMKNTNSPFWNEYFTFDITPKTKEITLDFYDYEKTGKEDNCHMDRTDVLSEQDDYLGQVIVPLSTVNRDQTCRLILPVLPRSTLSEHAKGDINLEFTFDKDGKIIDGVLPLVESTEPAADATEMSSPQSDPPVPMLNGYTASPQLNGHGPANERKLDVSLEDLVLEIEACDTMEVQPGPSAEQHQDKEDESKAKIPAAVDTEDAMAALEILDSEVGSDTREVGPDTHEVGPDTSEVGPAERAEPVIVQLSGEDKVDSEEPSTSAVQEGPRYKEDEEGARIEEKKEEEQEEGEKEEVEEENKGEWEQEKEEEDKQNDELKAFEVKPERKSKLRNSLKKFKRRPQSTSAGDKKESAEKGVLRGSDPCLTTEGKEKERKAEEEPGEEEEKDKFETKPTEEEPKPKRRSRLKIRRRPASMAAADRKEAETGENFRRDDTMRHSYHAGDIGESSNLQKAGSQTSLLSYFPCPFSTLVIETTEKGENKYFHIPQDMARRGTYEQKGAKLHVYNDHVFAAVHFSGNVPECAVCSKVLSRWVGKQGYQCRGCSMVTHKECHYQTSVICSVGAAKKLDILSTSSIVSEK